VAPSKARRFEAKLKDEAVRLVRSGKLSVKQAGDRFAVPEATLRRWIAQAAVKGTTRSASPTERARDRMIVGAAELLASRGLQATSFSEVLSRTDAPRGSVYHHFPGGKEQLVKAALDLVDAQLAKVFSPGEDASAEAVTVAFLRVWRVILIQSQFRSGCAVLAVTVAADSPDLIHHTGAIFRSWRETIGRLLVRGGLARDKAVRFAATLLAASEGAVVLSRAEQSVEPFDLVAAQMLDEVRRLAKHRRPATASPAGGPRRRR
jgi:AcrR family transcriptional regulator